MRAVLFCFLIVSAVFASEPQNEPLNHVIDVVKGIFTELNQKGDVTHICDCMEQVPVLVQKVEDFITGLKNINWKDMEEVFNMFISFFDAMKEVFVSLKPCVKIPADFGVLFEKIAKIDLDKLLQRIMLHSFEIFALITDALKDLNEQNYYKFGSGIGKIMYMFLLAENVSFA